MREIWRSASLGPPRECWEGPRLLKSRTGRAVLVSSACRSIHNLGTFISGLLGSIETLPQRITLTAERVTSLHECLHVYTPTQTGIKPRPHLCIHPHKHTNTHVHNTCALQTCTHTKKKKQSEKQVFMQKGKDFSVR